MTPPATHGSFTIDRHFDAKPERVFKAFADGDAKKLAFTEHATFLNGYDDPDAANRKLGSEFLLDMVGASLKD